MGLTLDEWGVLMIGLLPGLVMLNSDEQMKIGFLLIGCGIVLCYVFKKFKKLSEHFLLKSYLVSKGLLNAPADYPSLLNKRGVGK
jgi:hypothetical protein